MFEFRVPFWSLVIVMASMPAAHALEAAQDAPSSAERRVALVIGNADYRGAPLKNPVNDARAVAEMLRKLGFDVTLGENLNRSSFASTLRDFGTKLRERSAVGFVYFAGHGVQYRGRNYLMPTDANPQGADDVPLEGIDLNNVFDRIESASTSINIVVLDACRNNPYSSASRSAGQGLAEVDAPIGTYIAFATRPGSVAADGIEEHGMYTKHLLRNLDVPGIPIERVFKNVRAGVIQESNKQQVPWDSSSLTLDYYLAPAKKSETASTVSQAEVSSAKALWQEISERANIFELIDFLRRFPDAGERAAALSKLNGLFRRINAPELSDSDVPTLTRRTVYAGFSYRPMGEKEVAYRGLNRWAPMVVAIDKGSIAERAGLRAGDIILDVNGVPMTSNERFESLNWTLSPGELVQATILRNKKMLTVQAVMERPSLNFSLLEIATERYKSGKIDSAIQIGEYLCAQQYPLAQESMGVLYLTGKGVARDVNRAFELLQSAAEQRAGISDYYVGLLYANGVGVTKDEKKAIEYISRAAQAGIPEGIGQLGLMYLMGQGTTQDFVRSQELLAIALELGQVSAAYALGVIYEKGLGVPRDITKALTLYEDAARRGSKEAADRLTALKKPN